MSFLARIGAPFLRMLSPEDAHNATISLLEKGVGVPTAPPHITREPSLAVALRVSGLRLPNPIGLAAGFDKDARAFNAMRRFGFGFVECGSVTPRPQIGNPRPRLFRLVEDAAVINRMGFNNGGLDGFVRRLSAPRPDIGPVGANVGANKDSEDRIGDYVTGLNAVWDHADYLTLNISSPNTPGLRGLQDKAALEELLGRTGEAALDRRKSGVVRPIFLKVAPDLDDKAIDDVATAALSAPCLQGLIVSNTTLERPSTLLSPKKSETGGLSGAPLFSKSTEVLSAFHARVGEKLDLIGAGGVSHADHVLAKFEAGAQAVQLYSALAYSGPDLVSELCAGLIQAQAPAA